MNGLLNGFHLGKRTKSHGLFGCYTEVFPYEMELTPGKPRNPPNQSGVRFFDMKTTGGLGFSDCAESRDFSATPG